MCMTTITVVTHPALGDLVLQCPMAVYLAERFDRVLFPGRASDRSSLEGFFVNHPKVEWFWPALVPGLDPYDFPSPGEVLLCGIYRYKPRSLPINNEISFIENYYHHANIPMSVRWDYNPLQEASKHIEQHPVPSEPFEFIHDAPERGYRIRGDFKNPFFLRDQPRHYSILRYVELLKNAAEIHVIDSCIQHLAESVETTGSLFYHKYCKPPAVRFNDCDVPSRKIWNVLT